MKRIVTNIELETRVYKNKYFNNLNKNNSYQNLVDINKIIII